MCACSPGIWATSPSLKAKPHDFVEDAQVHQQPVHDVRGVAGVVRAAIGVPVQRLAAFCQPTGQFGPVEDHDQVGETKIATGSNKLRDDSQPQEPVATGDDVRLHGETELAGYQFLGSATGIVNR
jgi:hypothetical protein